jgi:hypothetical protein
VDNFLSSRFTNLSISSNKLWIGSVGRSKKPKQIFVRQKTRDSPCLLRIGGVLVVKKTKKKSFVKKLGTPSAFFTISLLEVVVVHKITILCQGNRPSGD